jgi:hypothetical protein
MGDGDWRRVGGRIKVRIVLSALEARREVPSGDLKLVSKIDGRTTWKLTIGHF